MRAKERLTWKDVVRDALLELGGQGHLSEIYRLVEGHPKTATNPTWRDTIRRVVRQYKVFEPVSPERSGIYRLVRETPVEPKSQSLTEDPEIDHGIAQGMLIALGKIYGYETFAPLRDQTIRMFQDKPLSSFVTVTDCTKIFKGPNVRQIREIDVLWFDENDYGLFPVYAFEVEQTTRVKSGLDRLLKIPRRFLVQLYIVGPTEKERVLFEQLINQTPFRRYKDRFRFRLYSELSKVYNSAVEHEHQRERFGITKWGR